MEEKKFSILYVDDEESNLRIFKNTFRKEYEIFTASSAKEGIKILEKEDIDVILSDQRMPEMTGVDFLKYALKVHPSLNRILITGYTDFKAIKSAINDAKIYQYVQKPWREDDLNTTIQEALKIYSLEKENRLLIENLKITNINLEEAKTKAEESSRLKSVFLSNLSHEIRTPLNGVIGFSEFLKNDGLTKNKRESFIDIIIRSGKQLLKIIEDIVEISKFETKQVKIREAKININYFFQDLFEICKTSVKDKDLTVSLKNEIDENESIIIVDDAKLQKVVSNLVDNAIRYTNEGFIEMSCKIEDNVLIVNIKDTGIGIEPDMHEKIFERFRQEDNSNGELFEGLGLGLSIVKENVEILGGKIKLDSEKGKGSTFSFEIPIKR